MLTRRVSPSPQEKQAENIVEKLCQRFRLSEDPRQWRDIAFCLSLLPFKSDRSVKKLIEGLPFYQDKLHEPKVFELFTEILTKVRARRVSLPTAALTAVSGAPTAQQGRSDETGGRAERVRECERDFTRFSNAF